MSVTHDIVATYRGPRAVVRRLLARGRREDMALLFLLFAMILVFVAQAPYQSRVAHLDPEVPSSARLYWSAMFLVFIMPFAFYVLSMMVWFLSKLAGRRLTAYQVRLTLFWALLAMAPVTLLIGLTLGFVGPGLQVQALSVIWIALFFWFWVSGMIEAEGAGA
ncbi:hypothetical protein AIOL_001842 [Candidatus Rhodobacter oscarellae]|uniref:Yip1 domain-containing protein n=1 Tax=Candidatus Rhodobacter oscarellae TaxID=1675527 RepID=A0A0J9E2C6_9RHOB|nr:hypothetical protein [Candidatus Rhodobacter lobularis]KMW56885.1 hypothetical protein AIOL_001842 [Candidatus Rhodobacter lobularis]